MHSAAAWADRRHFSCSGNTRTCSPGQSPSTRSTNFYRRYNDFAITPGRRGLQALARFEVGGTPRTNPTGYVLRSPTHWLKEIAGSGVRLQLWWSITDQIVIDQTHQSAHFYNELRKLRPRARVEAVTGVWRHSAEMRHDTQLPDAVRWLGLLPV